MEAKSKKEQLKWMVYVLEESILEETSGIKKLQLNEELRECKKELEEKYGMIYGIHYMKSY